MAIKRPESMEELVYFTDRDCEGEDGPVGSAVVWVYRKDCPKCGKAKMSKPANATGGVKIRSKVYTCSACDHEVEKKEYEDELIAQGEYKCNKCNAEKDFELPFKRKTIAGVLTFRIVCDCGNNLDVTKKMKGKKKKKKASSED